jgi:transcriptional regulator with XRE-family HTH domain
MNLKTNDRKGKANYIDKIVGECLHKRRVTLGITQEKLAKAIGVSIQQIQKYEKSVNRISSGNLYQMAKFLEVPIDYFFRYLIKNEKPIIINDSREKETISMINSFNAIKNPSTKRQLLALMRNMGKAS